MTASLIMQLTPFLRRNYRSSEYTKGKKNLNEMYPLIKSTIIYSALHQRFFFATNNHSRRAVQLNL